MTLSVIIIYALMFGAFFGMLWANKQFKAKGVAWGRPLAAVFGVCSLVFAVIAMFTATGGGVDRKRIDEYRQRELKYQRIAYKKLGEEIVKRHPGAKILLIKYDYPLGPEGGPNLTEEAQMQGLREGLDGEAEILVEEVVSSGMDEELYEEEEMSPEEMMENMLTAEKMDILIKANKNCNVVLSLAGLPQDYQLMSIWKIADPKKRPALVLANAYLYDLLFAFAPKYKFVTIALAHKAVRFDPNQPVPDDEQEAFDNRFMLITTDNVVQVAKDDPSFFNTKKK